jgi:hypothetical protein
MLDSAARDEVIAIFKLIYILVEGGLRHALAKRHEVSLGIWACLLMRKTEHVSEQSVEVGANSRCFQFRHNSLASGV